ncbi:MAG: ABC transporter permease, partial [Phycisphaerales bacterium]|nr:ABC transporter permease [Phycisphaerales bacterium]
MRGVLAIARRDLVAMYLTPAGWVILAAWGVIAGIVFTLVTLREGEPATLRAVVMIAGWSLAVLAPAISMRSFAEERRLGTLETLQSSPLSPTALVMGKWLACLGVLVTLAIPVIVLAGVAEFYGRPDPGELASGMIGLLLAGAAMTAVGVCISTRTSNQVVAYLLTFFAWFALVLVAKGLPAIAPQVLPVDADISWIDRLAGLDPLQRLDEFAIGLFSTANVVWFLTCAGLFLALAVVSLSGPMRARALSQSSRFSQASSTTLFIAAIVIGASGIAFIFDAPALRMDVDVTKTRAYSLGQGTQRLLKDLDGEWSVRLLVADDTSDPVMVRLVDEVLERMSKSSPSLSAERIDPTDPAAVARYEALLEGLLRREQVTIERWEAAIARGFEAFTAVRDLGRRMASETGPTIEQLPPDDAVRTVIARVAQTLGTVAEQGGAFESYLQDAMQSSPSQPIPDWPLVRTSLVANNDVYGGELEQLADLLRRWELEASISEPARQWAANLVGPVESVASGLRASSDELEGLEPLEISRLGVAIAKGDAAIVEGPQGVMVIPAWQLFPSTAVTRESGSVIGFDRRFRGEETLAAAIRSLRAESMPRVVFVHPEEGSMLR